MAFKNKCSSWVDSRIKSFFNKWGIFVGRHPGYFIIIPILLTALCATGFQKLSYNSDPEYLFSPTDGQAKMDRALVEEFFPTNFSDFQASRLSRPGKMARLVITAKDSKTLLRKSIWNQILLLDEAVSNVTVEYDGTSYAYKRLCAKFNSQCYVNKILEISKTIDQLETKEERITYPIYFDFTSFTTFFLPAVFGGISVDDQGLVDEVKALSLSYFLDSSERWMDPIGDEWERQIINHLEAVAYVNFPLLEVGKFTSNTPAWEMERSKLSVTPILCFNVLFMVFFCFGSAFTNDAVKSKPLVSLAGLLSSAMGTLAGFGFCMYIGVEFISLNFAAPFLLFGIGLDDSFVVLSCWQRSSPHLNHVERMGRAFSEAAVSITVTSLTNFFGFIVGIVTPFPCVQIFCLYSGVSIVFLYFWHITFFAGILVLAGSAEEKNRHGLAPCLTVTPKSLSQHKSWFYRKFMAGGVNQEDPNNEFDNHQFFVMTFFRDQLGGALSKGWIKAFVLLSFAAYLSGAIFGVINIQEGMDKRNIANFDSYAIKYYDLEDAYFKEYSYSISVVFSGPGIDFSNNQTQELIQRITKELENSKYIDEAFTQNWLKDFLDYLERNREFSDVHLPITTEQDFAKTLDQIYFQDPMAPGRLDVAFSADRSRVEAARFLIQGKNITDSLLEQNMVAELRDICSRYSTESLKVTVFQPFFIFIDQYLAIFPQAMQTIFITALVMVVISLVFIPSYICTLWVAFSIASIEIGVLGFMTLWDIRLDGVALINLVMCIGFSVDFSAHICYHFITHADEEDRLRNVPTHRRIQASLFALGWPIVQGAISTILSVVGLAFAPSYVFNTFFKMILLVILLGAMHGLVLLPVLLSFFGWNNSRTTPHETFTATLMSAVPLNDDAGRENNESSFSPKHSRGLQFCSATASTSFCDRNSIFIDGRRVQTFLGQFGEVNRMFDEDNAETTTPPVLGQLVKSVADPEIRETRSAHTSVIEEDCGAGSSCPSTDVKGCCVDIFKTGTFQEPISTSKKRLRKTISDVSTTAHHSSLQGDKSSRFQLSTKKPLRKSNTFPYEILLNNEQISHFSNYEDCF